MIDSNVSLDLMTFIEQNILPKYNKFGASHGLAHVQQVIKNNLEKNNRQEIDNMVMILTKNSL